MWNYIKNDGRPHPRQILLTTFRFNDQFVDEIIIIVRHYSIDIGMPARQVEANWNQLSHISQCLKIDFEW
jgi:hypothetical protein